MYNHNNTRQSIGILKKAIVSIRPTNETKPTSFVRSLFVIDFVCMEGERGAG
jgi:hypothetical protein